MGIIISQKNIVFVPRVKNNYSTYDKMLCNFELIDNSNEKFTFNFEKVDHFQGNMVVLLDLLKNYHFKKNGVSFITGCQDHIKELLQKNNFISEEMEINDKRKTTINFQRHYLNNERNSEEFYEYIDRTLNHYRLDNITRTLKDKIQESILELYTNIIQHGDAEFVSTCGQFFPKANKLIFSIGNLGNTFYDKISQKFKIYNSVDCIEWALGESNSTKNIPGGIGLYTLHEFVKGNKGQVQIISHEGFYEELYSEDKNKTIVNKKKLNYKLPGTIITLFINLDQKLILENELLKILQGGI